MGPSNWKSSHQELPVALLRDGYGTEFVRPGDLGGETGQDTGAHVALGGTGANLDPHRSPSSLCVLSVSSLFESLSQLFLCFGEMLRNGSGRAGMGRHSDVVSSHSLEQANGLDLS